MTHHKLGHKTEAKQWYDKAVEWTNKVLDKNRTDQEPVVWNRRLTLELLQKETAAMLNAPVEAPTPNTERKKLKADG